MVSDVSHQAAARREAARSDTGQFGTQSRTAPGDYTQADVTAGEYRRAAVHDLYEASQLGARIKRMQDGQSLLELRAIATDLAGVHPEATSIVSRTWRSDSDDEWVTEGVLVNEFGDSVGDCRTDDNEILARARDRVGSTEFLYEETDEYGHGSVLVDRWDLADLRDVSVADIDEGRIGFKPHMHRIHERGRIWAGSMRSAKDVHSKMALGAVTAADVDTVTGLAEHVLKSYRGQWADDEVDAARNIKALLQEPWTPVRHKAIAPHLQTLMDGARRDTSAEGAVE